VIAPDGDRGRPDPVNAAVEFFDEVYAPLDAQRVSWRIANVADIAKSIGRDAGRGIHLPDEPRGFAHAGRAVPRAGAVRRPEIERNSDQGNVEGRRNLGYGRAHEGCRPAGIARDDRGIEWLKIVAHVAPSLHD
jgi:hypothetical protein